MKAKEKYNEWINNPQIDDDTKKRLENMSAGEIENNFSIELEFGTGGLRGVMDAGTNRMNIYTVRKATQGLANEITDAGTAAMNDGVVIAYDSRNNSRLFALETANVLCANGIKTYLFESLRPSPELSFAVRYLKCCRGIVITASHNPKEYNGYKVYGEDGGQIPPETANKIIKYIDSIDIFNDVRLNGEMNPILIGSEVDEAYIDAIQKQSFGVCIPDDFRVVYTPIHGSGNIPVQKILNRIGIKNLFVVPEQELPNGDFPTVNSPNPENSEAFTLAIQYAKELKADLIFGTDPDSDRIGVVVKNSDGKYIVLNGNQTGVLLCEYILRKCTENGSLPKNATVIKTIVTTDMIKAIAEDYGADVIDVLTGFKYIGEQIKLLEKSNHKERFTFGLEESYGYLRGTHSRDKDAVVAAMLIAEMAAEYKQYGKNLYDVLVSIYEKYGYCLETLETRTLDGIEGVRKIQKLMEHFRNNDLPLPIKEKIDYKTGVNNLPKSDVLKFILDNAWFAVRPSGTEPKIKFYFGVVANSNIEVQKRIDILQKTVLELCDKLLNT